MLSRYVAVITNNGRSWYLVLNTECWRLSGSGESVGQHSCASPRSSMCIVFEVGSDIVRCVWRVARVRNICGRVNSSRCGRWVFEVGGPGRRGEVSLLRTGSIVSQEIATGGQ